MRQVTPPLPERLSNIVDAAWAALAEAGELPVVVEGSIPIAWFGDLEGYLQSPVRVITVGLITHRSPSSPRRIDLNDSQPRGCSTGRSETTRLGRSELAPVDRTRLTMT